MSDLLCMSLDVGPFLARGVAMASKKEADMTLFKLQRLGPKCNNFFNRFKSKLRRF